MADAHPGAVAPIPAAVRAAPQPRTAHQRPAPLDEVRDAYWRIDAAAASLRVFLIAWRQDDDEPADERRCATRQVVLRALAEVIECGQGVLVDNDQGGLDYSGMELWYFMELVQTAEQALWEALNDQGKGQPTAADLGDLLRLALEFHAGSVERRPKLAPAKGARAKQGGAA